MSADDPAADVPARRLLVEDPVREPDTATTLQRADEAASDRPLARALIEPEPGPGEPVEADALAEASVPASGALVEPARPGEIATLIAPPGVPDALHLDPATGEPERPVAVGVGAALSWLSVAASAASLLWTYWVAIDNFAQASWLMGQFDTEPGSMLRIGLAAGLTAALLLAMIANTIVGFYAWTGYRWSRIAGLIGAGLSLLMLLGGRLGWAAIPLAFIGAGLLWLPSARRYFDSWWRLRHPLVVFAPPTQNVRYGPLPRYR